MMPFFSLNGPEREKTNRRALGSWAMSAQLLMLRVVPTLVVVVGFLIFGR